MRPAKTVSPACRLLGIHAEGLKLVRLGAPVQRLLRLPLLAQARRWKNQFTEDQLHELEEKIAAARGTK